MKRLLYAMTILCSVQEANAADHVSVARARSLYVLHCAGCHQMDGSGAPASGVPSMRNVLGYFPRSPAGRALLVQVPGAINAPLTDAELAAVTNYELLQFSKESMPADFKPYTAEEVARARALAPLDVMATRTAVLGELRQLGHLPEEALRRLLGPGQ